MLLYVLTFAPTVAICVKLVPLRDCSTPKPVSLFELSVQLKFTWLEEAAVATRFVGAAGVGVGVGVAVGVGVGVGVGFPVPLIRKIFAMEGIPLLFKRNSM